MKQKCPKCGQWVDGKETNILGRGKNIVIKALSGVIKPKDFIEDSLQKSTNHIKESSFVDKFNPQTYVDSAVTALDGGKFYFSCPQCKHEWTAIDESRDQTEVYLVSLEKERCKSLADGSQEEVARQFVNEIRYKLSTFKDNHSKHELYAIWAFASYKFLNNLNDALDAIDESLKIEETPDTLALQGVIEYSAGKIGSYETLQKLTKQKEDSFFFSQKEIDSYKEDVECDYVEQFLDMPLHQRTFLVVDDKLNYLPDSFRVLSINHIPTGIDFKPFGYPVEKQMYRCHPYKTNVYFPIENYQLELFRDELDDLVVFLKGLGAKQIKVRDLYEVEKDAVQKTQVDTNAKGKKGSVEVGISMQQNHDSEDYFKLREEYRQFHQTEKRDTYPVELKDIVWYSHRTQWQSKARGRLMGDTHNSYTVSMQKDSTIKDFQKEKITAEFNTLVAGGEGSVEIQVDNLFKEISEHTWELIVDYYPLSEYKTQQVSPLSTEKEQVKGRNWGLYSAIVVILALLATILSLIL